MDSNTPNVTTLEFTVRSYEIGHNNTLLHGTIMNYLEEMAVQASSRAGYDNNWFDTHGYLWLIRKWYVRFEQPAYYGDRLLGKSWISDMKRVQSHREYELWRGDNRIVRARANWVFVDRNRGRPARLLESFVDNYGPMQNTPPEPIQTRLSGSTAVSNPVYTARTCRARHFEIDRAKHVNNAHYIRWLEDRILQDVTQDGIDPDDTSILAHEFEYRAAAQAEDVVEINSAVVEVHGQQALWHHQMRLQTSQERVGEGWSIVALPGEAVRLLHR